MNATVKSTETDEARAEAISAAQAALREKKTIVIPTDTVYGIAADAFSAEGVTALLAAKGRSRTMPPPVLIFDEAVLPGLADEVSADAKALASRFWPGALTLIMYSQPSLNWDLGDTQGTVALRVPDDQLTIDLLRQTGPLAVSSANKTGRVAATSAQEAAEQLGNDVELIIDGGIRPVSREEGTASADVLPSTIVDCTSERLVVVREGAISIDRLREVVPSIVTKPELEQKQKESAAQRLVENKDSAPAEEPAEADQAEGSVRADANEAKTATEAPTGLGDGPRAAAPATGTVAAGLITANTGGTQVDQMRTRQGHRQEKIDREGETRIKPFSVSDAHALVFSDADKNTAEEQLKGEAN